MLSLFRGPSQIGQGIMKLVLINRNVALIIARLLTFIPNFLCSTIKPLKTLKYRGVVGYIALLIEKGELAKADIWIFQNEKLFKNQPLLFIHLSELLFDKNYKLAELIELYEKLNQDFDLSNRDSIRLKILFISAYFKCSNNESGYALLVSMDMTQLDEQEWGKVLEFWPKITCECTKNKLFNELEHNENIPSSVRLGLSYERAVFLQAPHNVISYAERILDLDSRKVGVLKNLCAAYFLTGKVSQLAECLRLQREEIVKASPSRQRLDIFKQRFIQIGVLHYTYGYLHEFREILPLLRESSYDKWLFNYSLITSGVVDAYCKIGKPLEKVLKNHKKVSLSMVDSRSFYKGAPSRLLFLGNVNALCNQFMYSFMFNGIAADFSCVYVNCDERLKAVFQRSFPKIKFLGIDKVKARESKLPDSQKMLLTNEIVQIAEHVDSVRYMPFENYLRTREHFELFRLQNGWLKPCPTKKKMVRDWLEGLHGKKVGISVGSGRVSFERLVYRVEHEDFKGSELSKSSFCLVNLDYQYSSSDLEIINVKTGLNIVQPPIDLFNDIDGVLALISELELIFTTPNSTMDMAASVNKTCYTFDFTSQMKEWECPSSQSYIYSNSVYFLRPSIANADYKADVFNQLDEILIGLFCD